MYSEYCNKRQSEYLLKKFFSKKPVITKVKYDGGGLYFIEGYTIPGKHFSTWCYKCWNNSLTNRPIRSNWIGIIKGDKCYNLSDEGEPDIVFENLLEAVNKATEEAISEYNKKCDIFDEESSSLKISLFLKNLWHNIKESIDVWKTK